MCILLLYVPQSQQYHYCIPCPPADFCPSRSPGAAKLTTAWFLIERARLVSTPVVPRRQDTLYIFNFLLSTLWFAALALMLIFRISRIREPDGECLITMGTGPASAMIGIDAFLNSYYTSLFAVPLLKGKWKNPRLKQLAVKSALAAVLTVASSVANLGLLAAHRGTELSWVCLSTCTLDTVWCAVVLTALTGRHDDDSALEAAPSAGDLRTSFFWRRGPTADAPKSTKSASRGSNPFGPALLSLPSSARGLEAAPLEEWGAFGRDELGDGLGAGSGTGSGRRGSFAPDEMCLGAVNERKIVDGAWNAPSAKAGDDGARDEDEGDSDEGDGQRPTVGFAVLAREYPPGGRVAEGGRRG